jgi:anti-sigma regulatory factor (Ser/Thr protein kinase)
MMINGPVGDGGWTIPLPADADAPRIAREFVSANGTGLSPETVDDALVLVSELVTNALQHGRPDITIKVVVDPPGIGVSVDDEGEHVPEVAGRRPADTSPSGRGLLIVDSIATHWGVEPHRHEGGKTVWFELRGE